MVFKTQNEDYVRNICLDSGCANENEIELLANSSRLNNKRIFEILNSSEYIAESSQFQQIKDLGNHLTILSNILDNIVSYQNQYTKFNQTNLLISMNYHKLVSVIIKFLLSKICQNSIFSNEYIRDLFNQIYTQINIYNYTDTEIEDNLKDYRAEQNRTRKEKFDQLSDETKSSQRLFNFMPPSFIRKNMNK